MARWNQKYDWAKWFARPRFTLVKGRDFHGSPAIMAMQVHNASRRYVPGMRVEVERHDPADGSAESKLVVRVIDRSAKARRTYKRYDRARTAA